LSAAYVSTDYKYHHGIVMRRHLLAFPVALLLVGSVDAYQLALKDGTRIRFVAYRTTETTLFYTDEHNHESSIPLSSIDLDRTQQLNAEERPALILPGMAVQPAARSSVSTVSLGEAAHNVSKAPTSTAKHTFTDDDVRHSVGDNGSQPSPNVNSADEARSTLDEAEKFANTLAGKTARELAELEVGEVQFNGRDRWEQKLAAQRDQLVRATLAGVDASRRSLDVWSAKSSVTTLSLEEKLQLQEAQNAVKIQIANLRLERYRFDQIVADGLKSASELQRERNK
jgi:hypothetical protein